MTTYYNWQLNADADWFAAGGWSPAGPPDGVAADALISQAGTYTITLAATEAAAIGGLYLDAAAATLQVAGLLSVAGTAGNFDVADGAVAVAPAGFLVTGGSYQNIGDAATANASMTVSGIGATWVAAAAGGGVGVGNAGTGALTVSAAGTFTDIGELTVGGSTNGAAGTMTVSGGSQVTSGGRFANIGSASGTTGRVTVDGAQTVATQYGQQQTASTWSVNATDNFTIGLAGTGTLAITDGGYVVTASAYTIIGSGQGGSGSVKVDGNRIWTEIDNNGDGTFSTFDHKVGSTWSIGSVLVVGNGGRGTLIVSNGGTVDVHDLNGDPSQDSGTAVGKNPGSAGSTVSVSGVGSLFSVAGRFAVGWGSAGTLDVSAGGLMRVTTAPGADQAMVVAHEAGASGVVNVKGGTIELYDGGLSISDAGGSGTVNITAGGTVSIQGGDLQSVAFEVGKSSRTAGLGHGTVTVAGAGSLLDVVGRSFVGEQDSVGRLTVSAGATFDSTSTFTRGFGAIIGVNANAPGSPPYQSVGIVVVTGKGSTWTQTDVVASCVGLQGKGTLNVLAGGTVTFNQGLYAGYQTGGSGTVLVSGAGSTLGAGGGLYLGASYNGAGPGGIGSLTVAKGGAASFAGAHNYIFAGSTITVDKTSFLELGGTADAQVGKLVIDAGATLNGGGKIAGSVLDLGLIDTTGSLVVTGTLSGTGIARLEAGATLEVGPVASGTIDFNKTAATLKLDSPTHDHGKLSDLVAGDVLVLKNLAVKSASFVAKTLQLDLTAGGTLDLSLAQAATGLAASVTTLAGTSTVTIGAAPLPAALGAHSGTYLFQDSVLPSFAHHA